jgi:hypothetical protein
MGHLRTRKHAKNKRCYKIESFTHRPHPPQKKRFRQICSIVMNLKLLIPPTLRTRAGLEHSACDPN